MVEQELKQEFKDEIETILKEDRNKNLINKIMNSDYFNNFTFYKLKSLYFGIEDLYFNLKKVFEKASINEYMANTLDIEELYKIYKNKKLDQEFPNLNFQRLKELYENGVTSLKSPAYKNHIQYDQVIVRKYLIGIIQMIFNKMDLVVTFCGREGTGKTTASTQDAYLVYWLLNEIGLINYEYSLNNCMYHNLKSIIEGFNKNMNNPFRIYILDEGNELNRKDWFNPLVQMFFQKMRRERSSLRIIFINLPQLGELMPSITLSRVNFVFQLSMKSDIRTKLAIKGHNYFYIIPRFKTIYSYLNKKNLNQYDIINDLGLLLEDKKKYFQPLPKGLAIHKFERNGVWSFNEAEYEKRKKKANEEFSTSTITLTKSEVYFLGKYLNLKKLGIKPGTRAYFALSQLKNKKLNVALTTDESIKALGELEEVEDTEETEEINEND